MKKLLFLTVLLLGTTAFGADSPEEPIISALISLADVCTISGNFELAEQCYGLLDEGCQPDVFFKIALAKQREGHMRSATRYYQVAAFAGFPQPLADSRQLSEDAWCSVMRDHPVVPLALKALIDIYSQNGRPADAQICSNLNDVYFTALAAQWQYLGVPLEHLVQVSGIYEKELKGLL